MSNASVRFAVLAALLVAMSLSANLVAQETNRAALVISLGDGEVISRCVQFSEDQLSGYDLISRAELDLETEVTGFGARICRIEDTGCSANDCFCECKGGGDCIYWSYWHQKEGEWSYSNAGAHLYQVRHGDVEGWVWGIGLPNEAPPPPDLSFEDVCGAAATGIADGDAQPVATVQDEAIAQSAGIDDAAASNLRPSVDQAVASEEDLVSGQPVGSEGDQPPSSTWFIALAAVLLLVGLAVMVRVRARGEAG